MAFIEDDNKQQNQNGTPQTDQNGGQVGSSAPIQNSGGGIVSSAPTQTAGVGAGGSGWTNIQSYLDANKGNNASADYLNQQVGSQFDQEKNNLDQSASDTKSQADTETSRSMGQDQASKLIEDAGQNYSYGSPQSQQYNDDISKVKSAKGQYAGPSNYSYGLSGQTQEYGSDLGSDTGFHGLMNSLYGQASNGQITQGGLTLQQQLDQQNPNIDTNRQALLQKYAGLNDDLNSQVTNTNQYLSDAANQVNQNASQVNSYLQSQKMNDRASLNQKVSDINNYFQNPSSQGWQSLYAASAAAPNTWNSGASQGWDSAPTATLGNAPGVNPQRNRFNSIEDALGLTDQIQQAAPVKLSDATLYDKEGNQTRSTNLDTFLRYNRSLPGYVNPQLERAKELGLTDDLSTNDQGAYQSLWN